MPGRMAGVVLAKVDDSGSPWVLPGIVVYCLVALLVLFTVADAVRWTWRRWQHRKKAHVSA